MISYKKWYKVSWLKCHPFLKHVGKVVSANIDRLRCHWVNESNIAKTNNLLRANLLLFPTYLLLFSYTTTLSLMKLSIMTFNTISLNIRAYKWHLAEVTLSINDAQHKMLCQYAQRHFLFIVKLNGIMLNVNILNDITLSVVVLSVMAQFWLPQFKIAK